MQSTTATELNNTTGLHKSPKLNRGTTLNRTTKLNRGTPAPGFTLSDAAGRRISLADFRGQSVIVYFYPRAATPGCTTEACDFRDSLAALQGAGFAVRASHLTHRRPCPPSPRNMHSRSRCSPTRTTPQPWPTGHGVRSWWTAKSAKAPSVPPWLSAPTGMWSWRSTRSARRATSGRCGRRSASRGRPPGPRRFGATGTALGRVRRGSAVPASDSAAVIRKCLAGTR